MFKDSRGTLLFPIKDNKYMDKSPNISKDCTYSINKKNVLRGLHINTFGKLITCINGSFIDFMIHPKTLDFKYYYIKQGDQIYCPGDYAHGFISLEENSILSYHCEGYFGNEIGGLLNYKDLIVNKLLIPIFYKYNINEESLILNEKDTMAPYLEFDYFLLGSNGFIGSSVLAELNSQGKKVLVLKNRMEDLKGIKKLIQFYKPKYFINCAGLTGIPNTSWCNTNQKETLMTNVINQINILNLCNEFSVHCTLIGSGAIFKSSKVPKYSYSIGDLVDENNYYSKCRIMLEDQVKVFNNYLLLRINYPLSFCSKNLNNPKNLITKLLKYEEIENISLSVTNLDSMCKIIPNMIENAETGIYNFVNKGQINLIDLINIISKTLDISICKEYIYSKRESIILVPDKLEKYNVDEINLSLTNIL